MLNEKPLSDRQDAHQPSKSIDFALDDLSRIPSKSLNVKKMAVSTFLVFEGAFNNANERQYLPL